MSNYEEAFGRLAAYRKRVGMTQEQMAEKIGRSQEQYSHLENGITKITDKDLEVLLDLGWNIDYIITGQESEDEGSELEDAFAGFKDEKGKEFAMKLCAQIMAEMAERECLQEKDDILRERLILLKDMTENWQKFSMCLYLRKRLQFSQMEMANRLGVGVRKYRELEREKRYPDAEILLELYDMSGYRPVMFMAYCDRRMVLIKQIWKVFEEQEREKILAFIDYVKRMF